MEPTRRSDGKDVRESVWDYPRPPRVEPSQEHVVVAHRGTVVADTRRAWRVLETSHPPNYYIPPEDIATTLLVESPRRSLCEWKGTAAYLDLQIGGVTVSGAAWVYRDPIADFSAIRNHIAFYPQLVDECRVDEELVEAVEGSFYGGWVTSKVAGPFKGGPGTMGW